MQFQQLFSVLSLLALASSAPISEPLTIRQAFDTSNTPACPNFCAGTAYNSTLVHTYVCGDARLGPKRLPSRIVLSRLVYDYDRFGGLCPGQFLEKWFNTTSGYYNYPPDSGFQLTTSNAPIEGTITLPVGFEMDRFGSEYGRFVAPYGVSSLSADLVSFNTKICLGSVQSAVAATKQSEHAT